MKRLLLVPSGALLSLALFSGCFSGKNHEDAARQDLVAQLMDTTLRPGDDFFKYATNGWMKSNPMGRMGSKED